MCDMKTMISKGPSIKLRTHPGEGGSSLLYISIAFYMQKGGEGVQIACKIAYVINGRFPKHDMKVV